jgi:cyclase
LSAKSEHAPRHRKIAKDIYSIIFDRDRSPEEVFASNQGFVVLDDSVLVFDTGFSNRSAKWLDEAISQVTDKKVRYIVNSHDHSDHVFGNSYFSKKYSKFGLNIISHEICSRAILRLGSGRIDGYKRNNRILATILPADAVAPNVTYEIGFSLSIEGRRFILIHPENGAHTLGDTILAIPERGVMFMGDVFLNSFFPNIEDANIEAWTSALDSIDHTTYSKFLPGHGRLGGKAEVVGFADYLRGLSRRLLSLNSPDREKFRACFEVEGTEHWSSRFLIDRNIDALLGISQTAFAKI